MINNPSDHDLDTFGTAIHSGATKQGDIKLPALPTRTKQIKVYFTAFTSELDGIKPIFNVK